MVMGRVLKYVSDRMELGVVTLEGGLKDNAIPRECTAGLLIPEEKKEELTTYIKELTAELKKELTVLSERRGRHRFFPIRRWRE